MRAFPPFSRHVLLLVMLLIIPLGAVAATSVQLELDRSEATLGDTVTLKVKVSGSTSTDSPPQIQGLKDFSVMAGGASTTIEIVNFSKTGHVEFLYYLQPRANGTFTIGPAEIRDRGRVYRSGTSTLAVRETASGTGRDAARAEAPVFLRAVLSRNTAYADEPVMYTLKLYRSLKVSNVSLDIPDSRALSFKKAGNPLEYTANVEGQAYGVLEVRYEVAATTPGKYRLAPASMDMTVYQSGGSPRGFPFNDPFFSFSAPTPKVVRSNPVELTVLPLPAQGRPAGFSSLVGQYTMDAKLDQESIAAGGTATLTVTVQGRGNVARVPDLDLPDIPGVRIYPDQPALRTEKDAAGYRAVKTMKWAFVPQKEGIYAIPPLSLSFFDTRARAYRVLRTPPLTLKAGPGSPLQAVPRVSPAPSPQARPKAGVEELGRDVLPVHTGAEALEEGFESMPGPAVLWALVLGPPLVLIGGWALKRRRGAPRAPGGAPGPRGALKAFLKECSPGRSTAEELLGAARRYFNASFGSSSGTLTPGEAGEILERAGVNRAVRDRCVSFLEELTGRVFTGRGTEVFEGAGEFARLIRDIDRKGW